MQLDLIGKSYGPNQVLGPIRLSLTRGQRLAILGPSGMGKSTLLRIVAGLDPQFSGSITGDDRLALIFQEPTLLPWRNATHNITIPTGCSVAQAHEWMARVGLPAHHDHFPRQMSLGQQRRLALARAFAAQPDILLMDEPFASLDGETAGRMIALTSELLSGTGAGLLLVTHDPNEARALEARPLRLGGSPAQIQG